MPNRNLYFLKFLVILFCVYSSFVEARTEHKSENVRNNIDSKMPITLPPINIEKLTPEYQPIVKQLREFAKKYADKANEVAMLPKARQIKAGDKLEKDFNENFKKMQPKMKRLKVAPRNALTLGGGGSIYNHLNAFVEAINQLPIRIHCLIHDCSNLVAQPPITPITTTESDSEGDSYDEGEYY